MSRNMANVLIGKKIKSIKVDGFEVKITFTDGTIFEYNASDAGYSSWTIKAKKVTE